VTSKSEARSEAGLECAGSRGRASTLPLASDVSEAGESAPLDRRRVGRFEWEQAVRDASTEELSDRVKLTLLVLGTYSDADGTGAFPGAVKLGEKIGKSEKSVRGWLALAVAAGYLERRRPNRQKTYRCKLTIPVRAEVWTSGRERKSGLPDTRPEDQTREEAVKASSLGEAPTTEAATEAEAEGLSFAADDPPSDDRAELPPRPFGEGGEASTVTPSEGVHPDSGGSMTAHPYPWSVLVDVEGDDGETVTLRPDCFATGEEADAEVERLRALGEEARAEFQPREDDRF
jgi:hypothetical protein